MTFLSKSDFSKLSAIHIAVITTVIIGFLIALGIIVFEIQAERYSAVYINPESYSNYVSEGPITFVYGIHSYEKEKTDYSIEIFAGTTIVDTKRVSLLPGESFEEKKVITLPDDTIFPEKITVQTTTIHEKNEVHFWVKKHSVSVTLLSDETDLTPTLS